MDNFYGSSSFSQKLSFLSKFKGLAIPVIIILLIIVSLVYTAPKAVDFYKVKGLVEKAKELEKEGKYQETVDLLSQAGKYWALNSQKKEIQEQKDESSKFLEYLAVFNNALEKEKQGNLEDARNDLKTIPEAFPTYSIVKNKLDALQVAIEDKLKKESSDKEEQITKEREDAKKAQEEEQQKTAKIAAEAKRQQQEAAAAAARLEAGKAAAEAQAQAAAAQKAQAENQAAAAAQAARDAELQRQQEAARRVEEIKKSFRNELVSAYNSFNEAISYYGSGISYSNNNDGILAINQMSNAKAVLSSARNNISDLSTRFTGLSGDYYNAANNMISAIDSLSRACDLVVTQQGSTMDFSSDINNNKNQAFNYLSQVKAFLDASSY